MNHRTFILREWQLSRPPFDHNIASQKVLQKAGFELEAILKQAAIKNGQIVDMHYYSIIKPR
ncbi:MAG: GNAT family N-acetyltransferase [Tannerellaceae bacterium]|jgi:RimJ/RimL family protein N-acetyltransferase|nr:GNAT family N-acetyltransferase [Tannerellaceae bacterium]